jgi:thiol-disulfide isomerase/thioredoxin
MKKNIVLGIAIIFIIGAIWYLQSSKVRPSAATRGEDIASPVLPVAPQSENSETASSSASATAAQNAARISEDAKKYEPAREITPGGGFINTQPFTLKSLIGKKIILLDFWTYSCINCQRTTPYLNAWYKKYKDQGFVIVGVHTPEFDFEKDYQNVVAATKQLGIEYPVVQDNDYATWQTYRNRYWPHEYLININGYIVHDKIGEGGYAETEQAIQAALRERSQVLRLSNTVPKGMVNPSDAARMDFSKIQSREIYFGSARNEYLGNGAKGAPGIQQFSLPAVIEPNTLYLDGTWNFKDQYTVSTSEKTKIVFRYSAKDVYFVASADRPVKITIKEDGNVINLGRRGADVALDGTATIQANRLYKLISGGDYGSHTLEIIVHDSGLQAYTFTFG